MKTDEEIQRQITQRTLSRRVFGLFDEAIEKGKEIAGSTDQEIPFGHIPEYPELLSAALASMGRNRLNCEQIYMNPKMAADIKIASKNLVWDKSAILGNPFEICGITFYLTPAVAPNVIWALPAYPQTGVLAIPKFGEFLGFKNVTWLENYVDFPENVEADTLLSLINIKAPYKITVPMEALDMADNTVTETEKF